MSRLLRCRSSRRLQVVLGLALTALVFAPSASSAASLDTVMVTGSSSGYSNLNINAQSETSGQNSSGNVSFGVPVQEPRPVVVPFAGPVTCLSVIGPDHGAGTPGSPATAVLNFQDTTGPFSGSLVTLELVDHGGNGADIIRILPPVGIAPPRAPTDCSPPVASFSEDLTHGRATVFDAPLLPSTKAQCKKGGWRNYPQFKNQGQCVAFVRQQAREGCVSERVRIGRTAFRAKYGLGRYHLFALRRCVNAAAR